MALSKTNITTSLVASELGATTHDVGALCTHPSINPWAKCKPVNLKEPCPDRTTKWWKGDNGRCGFNIGVKDEYGSIHKLTRLDDVPNADWYYDFVTTSNPKRLADFGGYEKYAEPALGTGIDKDVVNANTTGNYEVFLSVNIGDDPYQLTINDFPEVLGGYYLGAAIKGTGTNNVWREFKGTGLILDGSPSVTIPTTTLNDGEYQMVLFAVNDNGDYYPLPSNNANKTSFTLKVGFNFPLIIDLQYISKSLFGIYELCDNYDETNPFKARTSAVYFKGVVRRIHEGSGTASQYDLKGLSEVYTGGETTKGLVNRIYDYKRDLITELPNPGNNIGDEVDIYIKWDGYGGSHEPEEPPIIGGDLQILYYKTSQKYYNIGGSVGFYVTL